MFLNNNKRAVLKNFNDIKNDDNVSAMWLVFSTEDYKVL
jgi:hypothetical protein